MLGLTPVQTTSLLVFLGSLAFAVVVSLTYDFWIWQQDGSVDTISHAIWLLSLRYKILPYLACSVASFIVGFFVCHFFGWG